MFLIFLLMLFYLNSNCDSFFYKNKKKLFIGASFTSFFIYYFYKKNKNNKGKNNNEKSEDNNNEYGVESQNNQNNRNNAKETNITNTLSKEESYLKTNEIIKSFNKNDEKGNFEDDFLNSEKQNQKDFIDNVSSKSKEKSGSLLFNAEDNVDKEEIKQILPKQEVGFLSSNKIIENFNKSLESEEESRNSLFNAEYNVNKEEIKNIVETKKSFEPYKEQNEKISQNNLNENELFNNKDYFIDNGFSKSEKGERNAIKVLTKNNSFLSYDEFIKNVDNKDNVFNLILKKLEEENNKDKDFLIKIDSLMNNFFYLFSEDEGTVGIVYEYEYSYNDNNREIYKNLLKDGKVVKFLQEDLKNRIQNITSIFDEKVLNKKNSSEEIEFVQDIKTELKKTYLSFIKENIDLEKYIELYKKCFYFSYLNACNVYFYENKLKEEIEKIKKKIEEIDKEIKEINSSFKEGWLGKFLINTGNKKAKEINENFDISNFNELETEGEGEYINPISLRNINMRFLEQNERDTFICSDLHGDITAFYVTLISPLKDAKNFIFAGDYSHRQNPKDSTSGFCNIFLSAILNRYENIISQKGLNILMLRGNHEDQSICQKYGNKHEKIALFSEFFDESEIQNSFCAVYPEIALFNRRKEDEKKELIAFSHGLPHSLSLIKDFEKLNSNNKTITLNLNTENIELIKEYYKEFFLQLHKISHFAWSEFCDVRYDYGQEKESYFSMDRGLHINKSKYLDREIDTVHGHQNGDYYVVKKNKDEDVKTKCFCEKFNGIDIFCKNKGHHGHIFLPVSSNNKYVKIEDKEKRNLVFCLLTKNGQFGKYLENGLDLNNLENVN